MLGQWTAQWRKLCLLDGLQAYRIKVKDPPTVLWLDHWITTTERCRFPSRLAPLIDNSDDWSKLRAAKYAADDVLKLCDPLRRVRLGQHLLCALFFDRKIFALTGAGNKPSLPSEQLPWYCRLLRHNNAYKLAFCPSGEHQVCWQRLVNYFSTALAPVFS